ncbi:MAG: hypothetical protein K0S65_3287 [Labilithrix sp.]|nr:hypothetical protein [Labilithrix sp.]
MNIDKPREPVSTEEGQIGDDERVEVLVEDLFIEQYDPQSALATERGSKNERGRIARVMSPIRARKKPILGGLLAIGGLTLAAMLIGTRSRKRSRLSRLLLKLGIVR